MKYTIYRCYIFPDGSVWLIDNLLCLCDVWKGRSYVNSNVSVSSIFSNGQFYRNYYFVHPSLRDPTNFTKMLKSLQFFIFIALGGTCQSLPKNVPYWGQQTEVSETSFSSIFFKMVFYIIVLSILAIGKHIDM